MNKTSSHHFKRTVGLGLALVGAALVTGCAGIVPAADIESPDFQCAQVEQSMGKPDMTWRNSQGKIIQAAYSDKPGKLYDIHGLLQ